MGRLLLLSWVLLSALPVPTSALRSGVFDEDAAEEVASAFEVPADPIQIFREESSYAVQILSVVTLSVMFLLLLPCLWLLLRKEDAASDADNHEFEAYDVSFLPSTVIGGVRSLVAQQPTARAPRTVESSPVSVGDERPSPSGRVWTRSRVVAAVLLAIGTTFFLYLGLCFVTSKPYSSYGEGCEGNLMVELKVAASDKDSIWSGIPLRSEAFPLEFARSEKADGCTDSYRAVCAAHWTRREPTMFNLPFIAAEKFLGSCAGSLALESASTCTRISGSTEVRKAIYLDTAAHGGLPTTILVRRRSLSLRGAGDWAGQEAASGPSITLVASRLTAEAMEVMLRCPEGATKPHACPEGWSYDGKPCLGAKCSRELRCTGGAWPSEPSCKLVVCKAVRTEDVEMSEAAYQGSTTARCLREGYGIRGRGGVTSFEVSCGSDGLFLSNDEKATPATLCRPVDCGDPVDQLGGTDRATLVGASTFSGVPALVRCKDGYSTNREKADDKEIEVSCLADGRWSISGDDFPKCAPVLCKAVDADGVKIPERLYNECTSAKCARAGYGVAGKLADLTFEVICRQDGGFSPASGMLLHSVCTPIDCGNPLGRLGGAEAAELLGPTLFSSEPVSVRCQDGFKFSHGSIDDRETKVTCLASGQWNIVDGQTPVCEPLDCGDPLPLFGGSDVAQFEGSTTYSPSHRVRTVTCKSEWSLGGRVDGETSAGVICSSKGVWHASPQLKCLHKACTGMNSQTVKCDEGFSYDGEPCGTKRTNCDREITCGKDGWTSAGECLPVRCEGPTLASWWVEHGAFYSALYEVVDHEPGGPWGMYGHGGTKLRCKFHSEVHANCLQKRLDDLELVCQADGTWKEPTVDQTQDCAYPIGPTGDTRALTLEGTSLVARDFSAFDLKQRWVLQEGFVIPASDTTAVLTTYDKTTEGYITPGGNTNWMESKMFVTTRPEQAHKLLYAKWILTKHDGSYSAQCQSKDGSCCSLNNQKIYPVVFPQRSVVEGRPKVIAELKLSQTDRDLSLLSFR